MHKNKIKNTIIISITTFALLFCNKSFSAIVSDNDGSAFITKKEFETLKNAFVQQVDMYNQSLEGKIDGAIASYLAGIKISEQPIITWNTLTEKLGGAPLIFKNKFKDIDTSSITTEVNLSITRDLCAKGEWGITCARRFFENSWNYDASAPNDHSKSYVNQTVWILAFGGTNAGNYITGDIYQRLCEYRTPDQNHYQSDGNVDHYHHDLVFAGPRNWSTASSKCVWTKKPNIQASITETIDGNGSAFIYHRAANGNMYLREYANVWPILNIDVWRHDYKDFTFPSYTVFSNYYLTDNGKRITDAEINVTATEHHEYGAWTEGIKYEGQSESSGTYVSGSVIQMKANDGLDYSIYQYGSDLNDNLVCLKDTAVPKAESSSSTFTASNMVWTAEYFNEFGKRKQINQFNDLNLAYTNIKQETESIAPSSLMNEYISNVAGENVRIGGGAPLLYTYDDGQDLVLKIKFASTGAAGDTIHYTISDKQFDKGLVAAGAHTIKEGDAVVGDEVEVKISSGTKQQYWINMYSNTEGKDCTIEDIKLIMEN